jgi:hypothetical protein
MKLSTDAMLITGAVAVGAVALWWLSRNGNAQAVGTTVGEAAVSTVVGAGTGVVLGVGDAVGVPRTNQTECERAIAEGRTWDASFACPAGTFIKSLWK